METLRRLPQTPDKPERISGLPPRQIIYQRSGNLAKTTQLDIPTADRFMQVSDMRRDIVIVDSDKSAEYEEVNIGDDTLAFEIYNSVRNLGRTFFRGKHSYDLSVEGDQFEVRIHEKQIDHDVRATHYVDKEDYNSQFLRKLNQAIKEGISQSLFREKLGITDQRKNYLFYLSYTPWLLSEGIQKDLKGELFALGTIVFFWHPILNLADNFTVRRMLHDNTGFPRKTFVPPSTQNRSWKEGLLPLVPIDKWIK
ncbi:hypothetical protein HYT02_05235 [Candidatus Gottesmanbacteria bacterium]|nr:hypothetical protein [Candidatus Gottesmanbacteria bacterium]